MTAETFTPTDLIEMIGPSPAFRLIEARGGTRIRIPYNPHPQTFLAREIGVEAAHMFSARFGGDAYKVPLARAWRTAIYRAQGLTISQTALRLGINEGSVSVLRQKLLPAVLREAAVQVIADYARSHENTGR